MFNNKKIRSFIVICFLSILLSRLIPHPPNFTTAIAVAFYLPALFGIKYILLSLAAFMLSDLLLGLHNLLLFTWTSIFLIGVFSKYFKNFYLRLFGATGSCIIFFAVSNFGVWLLSMSYEKTFSGLLECYMMGLPFLQNSLISTIGVAILIEFLIRANFAKNYISKINTSFSY